MLIIYATLKSSKKDGLPFEGFQIKHILSDNAGDLLENQVHWQQFENIVDG